MKVFCREEMQQLEHAAERAGVTMQQLMEQAGAALAREAARRVRPIAGRRVALLCGSGNNGGDGFVCARLLAEQHAACTVLLLQGEPTTELAQAAFAALPGEVRVLTTEQEADAAAHCLRHADVVIDCVFGFGFHGELPPQVRPWLERAAQADGVKIAADLPSGTECDSARAAAGAFSADCTVAFTAKKPVHCCTPAMPLCGEVIVAQVGVPPVLLAAAEPKRMETDRSFVQSVLPAIAPQSHKGSRGRLLLLCGSYGMVGACIMAARAALRSGVGLLHICAEERIYPMLAQAVPEAVFTVLSLQDPARCEQQLCTALEQASACVVGCGLGETAALLLPTVLSHSTVPLLLDADALNELARHPELADDCECPLVMTPHPGEMARLCGDSIAEIQADRITAAHMKAKESGAVILLKGPGTVIAAPDGRIALNPTVNAGLARGGSGDVLAGMIGALLAQGVAPFAAAAAGAWLHGAAGDLCAKQLGQRAMLPTDLPELLPQVFQALEGENGR